MSQEFLSHFEDAVAQLQNTAKHGAERSGFDTPQFVRMMFEVADVLESVECKQTAKDEFGFVVGNSFPTTFLFPVYAIRNVLAAMAVFVGSQHKPFDGFGSFNVYGDSKEVELSAANGGARFHVETMNGTRSVNQVYGFSIRKIGSNPSSFLHLDPRLACFVARHGASAFETELVGEGDECGHVTASARIWNAGRTHFVQVRSAKNQRWQLPGAHGEGNFDLKSVAMREARRALGLPADMELNGEASAVLKQQVEEYWNTPAHLHLEIVWNFEIAEPKQLPIGTRWYSQKV